MSYINGGVFAASTASYGVFIESIRCSAPCANGVQERNKPRSAVTIGVFANQGAMRA